MSILNGIDYSHLTFISAGAGSGKTYRLTQDLEKALVTDGVHPAAVIGTTFTVKAAGELKERVRSRLIESGRPQLAEQMAQALIGTVHSVCERLLKRFSFELGLSPALNVMSVVDGGRFFNQALDEVLSLPRVREMNALAARLGQEDWQADVKAVADKVRENDLAAGVLPAMASDSADALLAFFPAARDGALTAQLVAAVEQALSDIDTAIDTTKTTAKYLRLLRESLQQLRRDGCYWKVWIDLSATEAAKKSEAVAARVRDAAVAYEAHPEFQADLRGYIESVMQIAGLALQRFQQIKTERGLIDFLDMEQLTLHALDHPSVRARLGDELELLLVDEFQDTNPMQLALFVKLAALADRVIFVGDVKQAIYAFRGCDPDLVLRTLQGLASGNATTDTLPDSWRSRPALVHYVNAVFAAAFDGEIPREQVVLTPQRAERTDEPAVLCWQLAGGNKGQRAEALAQGISELVHGGFMICDPHTGEPRPVRWGDIAVLARSNDNIQLAARTLKNWRVPIKMTLAGLLETPEICLARACLRRLNDASDTLATAEIISLADCAEPETWLEHRMRWVAEGHDANAWQEADHPIIGRLAELRRQSTLRSPVEIVARVLNDVGTRRIATGWGPDAVKAGQRQRNLDAFLDLAVKYEDHCEAQHEAATLTGFLFWLNNPSSPELDLQPVVASGDAVHVLTYHRAKGLEWPVVVVTDFDAGDPSKIWGVRVLATEFDVARPLDNRFIRFWPNVFGRRSKNVGVLERVLDSAEGRQWQANNAAEQRRVAYVGMTRARDLLAIALPAKGAGDKAWLQTFGSAFTVPDCDVLELPDGERVPTRVHELDGNGARAEVQAFTPRWFVQRQRMAFPKEIVNPSAAEPVEGATMGEIIELGERIPLKGGDMTAIGSALHAVIAAEMVNPGQADAVERAAGLAPGLGNTTSLLS